MACLAGGREGNCESLSQLEASLSKCRELRAEGVDAKHWLQPLRKHRFMSERNCLAEPISERQLDEDNCERPLAYEKAVGCGNAVGRVASRSVTPNRPNFTEEPFFEYAMPEFGSRAPVAQIRAYSRHASAQCAGYE